MFNFQDAFKINSSQNIQVLKKSDVAITQLSLNLHYC